MAKLESLVVDLTLQTAELRAGLDEVKAKMKESSDSMEGLFNLEVFKELAHVAVEAAEKFAEFAMHGAEVADAVGKMAQQASISTESFSQLSYAAKLSKVSGEELGAAFKHLNVSLSEAAAGSGKQSALFNALGVAVKDASGHARSADDVMRDLAEKFSMMEEGPAKAALAVEVFGKAGAGMLPFLNEGKEGLKKLSDEADRFGLTISGETAQAATEFNDNLERMKTAVGGLSVRVAAELAPTMAELTGKFAQSQAFSDALDLSIKALTTTIKLFAAGAILAAAELQKLQNVGITLGRVAADLSKGDLAAAARNFSYGLQAADNIAELAAKSVAKLFAEAEKVMRLPEMDFRKKLDPGRIAKNAHDGADALKEQAAAAKRLSDSLEHLYEVESKRIDRQAKDAFASAQGFSSANAAAVSQKQAFADIGADPRAVLERMTAGFANFNEALNKQLNATVDANDKMIAARQLESDGRVDAAIEAEASADMFKDVASNAGKAANAFLELDRLAREDVQKAIAALGAQFTKFVSKLGDFGQVVNSAIQGFQQGGWWGALAAVLVEVVSRFKGFSEVVDVANKLLYDFIGSMSQGLSSITEGLVTFLTALNPVMNVIGSVLNPILHSLGDSFQQIGNVLDKVFGGGLGDALSSTGDILDAFMQLAQIMDPLAPIIKIVGALFSVIGVVISYLNIAILKAVGWFLDGARQLFSLIGLNDLARQFSALAIKVNTEATTLEAKASASWDKLGHTFDDFFGSNAPERKMERGVVGRFVDLHSSLLDTTTAVKKAGAAFEKLTEQFSNVPEGFKTALRTFQAIDAAGSGTGPGGTGFGKGDTYNFNFAGSLLSELQLLQLVDKLKSRQTFQLGGRPRK